MYENEDKEDKEMKEQRQVADVTKEVEKMKVILSLVISYRIIYDVM